MPVLLTRVISCLQYIAYTVVCCAIYTTHHARKTLTLAYLYCTCNSYDPLSFATMSSGYAESTMALRHTVVQRRSSSEESGKPTRPSAVDQFFSNVNNVNESSYFTFSTSLLLHLRISERQRYPTVHQSPAACITLV